MLLERSTVPALNPTTFFDLSEAASATREPLRHRDSVRTPSAATYVVGGLTAAVFVMSAHMLPVRTNARDFSAYGEAFAFPRLIGLSQIAFSEAFNEMNSYRWLEPGWDGVGSVTPNATWVDNALKFLAFLPGDVSAPEPTVSADGSIGWYWDSPTSYVMVSFSKYDEFSYFGRLKQQDQKVKGRYHTSLETVPQELVDVIRAA